MLHRTWSCSLCTVLIAFALSGCARPAEEHAAQWAAKAWITALNSRNTENIMALLTADGNYQEPTTPTPLTGAALRAFWANMWRQFPNLTFTAEQVVAAGDSVAIEWQSKGTHTTGKVITISGISVIDVHGDRVARVRAYYNAGVYLQFLTPKAQ